MEIWRDIEGYDGLYQISNLGHVKRFYKATPPRILKSTLNTYGYPRVSLGRNDCTLVHRLVATAFIPNPEGKPQVNHIDGNPRNSHVTNLEWCTSSENHKHAYDTGLRLALQGEDSPDAKLTNEQVVYIRDNPDGLLGAELATVFNVTPTTISEIQQGKIRTTAGGTIRKPKRPRVPDEIKQRIRAEYKSGVCGCSTHALAKKYGIGQHTIWRIVHGR